MDLRKFGFTSSAHSKTKKDQKDAKEKKKIYETKRERHFQSSWLEEFPGLTYAKPIDEKGEPSTDIHDVMLCQTCIDNPECSDMTSFMVVGTSAFRKDTIVAHWKSKAHVACEERKLLKEKTKKLFPTSSTDSTEVTEPDMSTVGPMADCCKKTDKKNEDKIKKLINTAYYVAQSESPFTDYPRLICLQEKNGLDMGNFYRSDNACRRFVKSIYQELLSYPLQKLRDETHFFSILIDGATDASVTENELIYIRFVDGGTPVNHYFSIENIAHDADSAGILECIEEAFRRNGLQDWKTRLVGFGSDGASVNLGSRSGIAARIKTDVAHLIVTHCVAHRLELAANNAIKHHKVMREIQDILQHIYKHYHYSPKALRELRLVAEALEENILKPTNLSGTRWLPYIEKALGVLIRNFRVILSHFEHIVESRKGSAEVQGRAKFVSKKLKDYRFLFLTFFMLDVLKVLSQLSLKMQRDDQTLSQLFDALVTAQLSLIELRTTDGEHVKDFISKVHDGQYQDITLTNIQEGNVYTNTKQEMLELICDALDSRFGPTEKDPVLHAAADILNFAEYPRDLENLATFGQEQTNLLLQHFHDLLERGGCNMDLISNEWKDFKAYIFRHRSTDITRFFLFPEHKTRFPNLLLVFEVLLTIPLSSAACERGFSAMKRIKTDWRSVIQPDMLRRLMFISIEGPSVTDFNVDAAFNRWWSTGRAKRPGFNPFDYRKDSQMMDEDGSDSDTV